MPYTRSDLIPLLLFAIALVVIELTGLDDSLMGYFYDPGLAEFPLRNAWLTEALFHTQGRRLMFLLGLAIIMITIASLVMPVLKASRNRWLFVLSTIVVSTISISLLKKGTGISCAWDLAQYGGDHLPNTFPNILDGANGACWPAGHASGPFSLIAIYFGFRDRTPAVARVCLLLAMLLGTIFGLSQTARGAHYLSHTVWTLLIIWSLNLGTLRLFTFSVYPSKLWVECE